MIGCMKTNTSDITWKLVKKPDYAPSSKSRNPPPRLNPTSVLESGAQLVQLSAVIGVIILAIAGTAPPPSFTSQHGHQYLSSTISIERQYCPLF
uniref:Uncharacterized protein n=1 Tax=Panagrellus redivivus TaxID=6233 RepID=A0A7E4VKU4_PANRE